MAANSEPDELSMLTLSNGMRVLRLDYSEGGGRADTGKAFAAAVAAL